LKDSKGKVVYRLYQIRNPYNTDVYNGPWSDNDGKWTDSFKSQVPYVKNTNDGAFFMEEHDFVNAYSYFSINHVHDDYVHSWYEQTGDNGRSHSYKFTAKKG